MNVLRRLGQHEAAVQQRRQPDRGELERPVVDDEPEDAGHRARPRVPAGCAWRRSRLRRPRFAGAVVARSAPAVVIRCGVGDRPATRSSGQHRLVRRQRLGRAAARGARAAPPARGPAAAAAADPGRRRAAGGARRPCSARAGPRSARASCASLRLRTIRARWTRLIWPFSSDTTTTIASVCSVVPSAARWRVPKRSAWIVVSPSGSTAPAATIRRAADDRPPRRGAATSARRSSAAGRPRGRRGSSRPVSAICSRPGLPLDHDERAVALGREHARRPARPRSATSSAARLLGRHEPAERADAADPVERAAQLRLEDDDEREQADDGARLEDLGEQPQAEDAGPRSTPTNSTVTPMTRRTALVPRMRLNSQ